MTAEILIMNKLAVALAADSAVTVSQGTDTRKVFNTACKLFALSKFEPVGVMFYGNADLSGVPWELVIKSFREWLGQQTFSCLFDYGAGLIQFIENSMFTESVQTDWLRGYIGSYWLLIREEVDAEVQRVIAAHGEITLEALRAVVDVTVTRHVQEWRALDLLPIFAPDHADKVREHYAPILEEVAQGCFEQLPISDSASEHLLELAGLLITRDRFASSSGIVVAGFGCDDVFPSFIEYHVEGVALGKLKYKEVERQSIDIAVEASIKPLAQQEVVRGFLLGVEPDVYSLYNISLRALMEEKYPQIVLSCLDLPQDERNELEARLSEFGKEAYRDIIRQIDEVMETHSHPVIDAVRFLQKDELAEMAESFVNLTSLKRRISLEPETVGGPIDVAVISKGDGFIWIKRKHYFKAELNPQFFANYYRNVLKGD